MYSRSDHNQKLYQNNLLDDIPERYPKYIEEIISICLNLSCPDVKILVTDCKEVRKLPKGLPGLYLFFDPNSYIIYYVGESSDLKRRVYEEHCRASIGSSEGVVRFLMFLMDRICVNEAVRNTIDVKKREKIVKNMIKEFVYKLKILVAICPHGSRKTGLREAEKCIIEKLKPILNPI